MENDRDVELRAEDAFAQVNVKVACRMRSGHQAFLLVKAQRPLIPCPSGIFLPMMSSGYSVTARMTRSLPSLSRMAQ